MEVEAAEQERGGIRRGRVAQKVGGERGMVFLRPADELGCKDAKGRAEDEATAAAIDYGGKRQQAPT
ncbi:hypothetical protein M5K25_009330 [Dendrobium thyrsiflorum]|uniref:Uncharacterized protein n=1 Tax=Dendrobium thyrsiflorum TaxID=117978 RepID=A0ABD0V625_DENTH